MPTKKLIEFGWDEPDTRFMREHLAEMEQTPFDGCVFHINYDDGAGGQGNFTWECWGNKVFTESQLASALGDLRAIHSSSLTHNFLRFNVTPGDVDWFGDFSAVLANASLAASLAKQGGCTGILFDIEQYNSALFNYPALLAANSNSSKSWEACAKQVRKRGREAMEAFQASYPEITVFLTFGYCLPWAQVRGGKAQLSEVSYGLLAPFLDGLVDGANGQSMLVDGHESSYSYRDITQFPLAYQRMQRDLLPIVANPDKYRKVFRFGFGVWMDHDWRRQGWNTEDFGQNYYTPDAFHDTILTAMQTTDEYVWIYTEQPRWWSNTGQSIKLPQEYVDTVWRAKREIMSTPAPDPR